MCSCKYVVVVVAALESLVAMTIAYDREERFH